MKKRLFVLLSIIPLLLGGILLYQIYNQVFSKTLDQLIEQQKIYANQAAGGIESFFNASKSALNLLANHESVIFMNENMKDELIKFYESYRNEISAVTRINKDGILNYTVPFNESAIGKDVSYQPHNALIIKNHTPVVSDVFTTVQGYRAIAFAYPVFNEGEYNGCVSLLIPFDIIAKKFLENIEIGKTGYAFVLSEGGVELYCPLDEHTGISIYETSRDHPLALDMAEKMLNKKSGIGEYFYYKKNQRVEEVKKIAVYRPVELENTFWSIAVTLSIDEALTVNDSFVNYFLLTVLISGITFFVFVFSYFRSKINSEKKLREEEEKYRVATEQTGQMIYEYDLASGKIKWSGAIEEVVGYTLEEFNSFNYDLWYEYVHPDDKENLKKMLNESKQSLGKFHSEYRFKNKDGNYIYVEDNGVYKFLEKESVSMIGTMKDITSRKLAEKELAKYSIKLEKEVEDRTKELREANVKLEEDIQIKKKTEKELLVAKAAAEHSDKVKSEFLAQMSHEIRTPINSMMNFSSLLKDAMGDKVNEDLKLSFTVITNAGKRIIRTIDLLLNMSEIHTGAYKFEPQVLNLYKDVLENLKLEYYSQAKEKGLEFVVNCCQDYTITGDEYTLSQMFSNLIDNAIKYTPQGKISINCRVEENKKLAEVIDTGIGISENYLPYLFDSFSQEEQGYTRKFEGTGLGLALVKKYCELNNAEIFVESKKGEGSKFTIIFK